MKLLFTFEELFSAKVSLFNLNPSLYSRVAKPVHCRDGIHALGCDVLTFSDNLGHGQSTVHLGEDFYSRLATMYSIMLYYAITKLSPVK